MVLTKPELLGALQQEVRILVHLAGKVEPAMRDYRPTPKQRSTFELLKYLSMMGPTLVKAAFSSGFDPATWKTAHEEAEARDFDQTLQAIASLGDTYTRLLENVTDQDFRSEMTGFDGRQVSRGSFIVNLVLCGHAAYRTQLFCYLKSCGREELSTMNLWAGVDAPAPQPA